MANVQPVNATTSSVDTIKIPNNTLNNTAQDWFRDMRMSADVNKTTVGVESDVVTPDLLLATSKKLLNILQQKAEPDPKDSLEFQRFYGPAEYFAEHVLRDSNKVGRNLLWKATNKGNLDFMQPGSLDKHISDVFYDSKLSQMVDASSPLELMDVANKTTRLGEGGIEDLTSAPDEMRTVQPSFFGFLDPVRCYAKDTELMTDKGWVKIQDITKTTKLACLLNGDITYHEPYELHSYKVKSSMYLYGGPNLSFNITPNHRMYYRRPGTKKYCTDAIEDIKVKSFYVRTGTPIKTNDTDYDWSFIADTIVNATIHSETYKTDVLEKYMYSADTSLKKSFLIALRKNLEVSGSIILYDEAFVDFITKIAFDGTETIFEIKDKLEKMISENKDISTVNNTDAVAKFLGHIPDSFIRKAVKLLSWMDKHGIMPKSIIKASPFHTSVFLTNVGSLGIDSIYHHLYNFGTTSMFFAMGKKKKSFVYEDDEIHEEKCITLAFVGDERICDGYYYASSFKSLCKYLKKPELLEEPGVVKEDVL